MAKNLSTFAIAQMLHVDPGSVANWVDQDKLRAFRTPGGHRRVRQEDLLVFLREHDMPIPPELAAGPKRVVIVDDEKSVSRMLAKMLQEAHPEWEIMEASSGFIAGTMIATYKPDVVILDLRMPGMDGFEVCKRIKSHDETKQIAVIAMTAHSSKENVQEILACGAMACLPKPLDLQQLLQRVEACMI